MNPPQLIPCLPETAPFTPEQRAYLNGFLAGIWSRTSVSETAPVPSPAANVQQFEPLTVLFGSQTGNAETLARRIAREAGKRGFAPTVYALGKYPLAQLPSEKRVLLVTSTYGDGEPPDDAKHFWTFLSGTDAPKLVGVRFSVCALGDSNYPKFCGFGKDLDARLASLGGISVQPRADCDTDFEQPYSQWVGAALNAMSESAATHIESPVESRAAVSVSCPPESKYSRSNPLLAALVANRVLNAPGSTKETRHFEFDLNGSGLDYQAGDALGVVPSNCPAVVDELLRALRFSGGEAVPIGNGNATIREALQKHYEVTRIPQPLLRVMAERTGDALLRKLASPESNGELSAFLRGRDVTDLLIAHPAVSFTPIEFVGLLKKLAPRLYSIASSPKAHAGRVHLTVNVVRYECLGRRRQGVCSTFLADRVPPNEPAPVFLQPNRNFRLPANSDAPVIMVGPGTGVAPFRAFLSERAATGAKGRNWLFFGDQRAATDFMYRDELEALLRQNILTRLHTAFSRDQAEKVYVQDRMRENGRELFDWLEQGGHFYVCGDATRMAKDVDAALHDVICTAGQRSAEQAREYVERLKQDKRYQRDVY